MQDTTPPIPAVADNRPTRLEAVLKRLKLQNPFAADFREYAARLDTGREASAQFADKKQREAHNNAVLTASVALANISGLELDSEEANDIYYGIATRAALTAKWYDVLCAVGIETGGGTEDTTIPPELALYTIEGIPAEVAQRFYDNATPPKNAADIYRMIYPETEQDKANIERIAGVMEGKPDIQRPPTPRRAAPIPPPLPRMVAAAKPAKSKKKGRR